MSVLRKSAPDLSARSAALPPEFEDAVVWVAWLYYADQLTQNEIADQVGVSRATIVKLLQEARERGVVSIRLNTEAANRTRLSRALVDRFGLSAATLIPPFKGQPLVSRLGDAGARVLTDQIQSGDIIGVAWGRTVLAVARALTATEVAAPLTVVQVAGSSAGSTADFSPELCASLLANRLSARCVSLLAPAVVSTPDLRDRLLNEPWMSKQLGLIRSANRLLFGVGDLGGSATVREAELAGGDVIDQYVDGGAVAVMIGRFVDAEGRPVAGELDGRMIGITLDEMKAVPSRLCVAGGPGKVKAIRAALNGGFVTHLVTDAETADHLLNGS